MAKQMTKKQQQVSNQVTVSKVENQAVKVKVSSNQVSIPKVDIQEVKLEESNQVAEQVVGDQAENLEVSQQAAKPEVNDTVSLFNLAWDEWLNGVKQGWTYQSEMEDMACKAIDYQKDFWMKSLENLEKVEIEINKYTDHAKSYVMKSFNNLNVGSFSNQVQEWNIQVGEVTNQLQKVYGTPGQVTSSLVAKSLDQWESTLKATIQQQQRSREEGQLFLENLIDQAKETNQVLMNTWEKSQPFSR